VRLLLDDNNTPGLDPTLAALDAHPNIEVRLFNPFVIRKLRIGYLTDFHRANRRMHNKSFTVDNQVTIIGGRNIGDEYFGATEGVLFTDLDVIGVGAVVAEVSNDFDRYWASQSSYPAGRLLPPASPGSIEDLAEAAARIERDPAAAAYTEAAHESSFARDLIDGTLALEWAPTRIISDDPAKGLDRAAPGTLLTRKLSDIFGEPSSGLNLVSPYFVPTASGVELFAGMAQRGVKVRVLVNSLEATDVPAVHAGYAKRRKPLLEAGITLYELRRFLPGAATAGLSPIRSSGSSLHAKTFAVDGSRVFIGSFNFDPRSAELNTEMGFVIDSPALARQVEAVFDDDVPPNAYEVRLSDAGELYWIERRGGETIRHETEPGTSFGLRALVRLMALLPIESLL
jgi:putative cardiolipin synthase